MRRAEEASTRQRAQAGGPSFVEYQDKEFAKEADAEASPQLSSKRSCERRSWGRGLLAGGRAGAGSRLPMCPAVLVCFGWHPCCRSPPLTKLPLPRSSPPAVGRSFTLGRSPQTPPGDVADEDLLAGSELSSPPPSGGSSISKSRSLKKLFSSKK